MQNLNIGRAKSEHLIYNDTDFNDTDFIDTQSINPSCANADRQTDRTQQIQKEMSFSEMLEAINYPCDYLFESESEFKEYYGDDDDYIQYTKKCAIPYWLKSNPNGLKMALKFIFAYNCPFYVYDTNEINGKRKDNEMQILLDVIIKSLLEMLEKDHCTLDKRLVKYHQIIDIINEVMQRSYLRDWALDFKDEWAEILSKNDVKRPEVYIKTCIWNSLNNYQFKSNNICLMGEYDCEHGFPNNKKSNINNGYRKHVDKDFDINLYKQFINDFNTI